MAEKVTQMSKKPNILIIWGDDINTKRMETVDEEFLDAALDFIDRAHKSDTPFFVWWNSTRMHIFTHLKKESEGNQGIQAPFPWTGAGLLNVAFNVSGECYRAPETEAPAVLSRK